MQNRNRFTDVENRPVVAEGEGRRKGTDRRFWFSRREPLHLEWINNKVLTGGTVFNNM